MSVIRFSNNSLYCGPTCTILFYTLCGTISIGCEEGSGWVPDETLTGLVSDNYLKRDQLMVQFEAVTNANFENDICTSIDPIYGGCNGFVQVQDAGLIEVLFVKTPIRAILLSHKQKIIENGTIQTGVGVEDSFSSVGFGSVLGNEINPANPLPHGEFMGFESRSTLTRTTQARPRISELLASQLPEVVRRSIEMLELRMMKP